MTGAVAHTWLRLAWRFVLRHRRKTIATGGFIGMGTAILVLVFALTTGINDTMVLNTTALHVGHVLITLPPHTPLAPETVARLQALEAVNRALLRYRLAGLASGPGSVVPMILYGVTPGTEAATTAIAAKIHQGRYPADGKQEILMGSAMAGKLGVTVGDRVLFSDGSGRPPTSYRISGLFQTGVEHFDTTLAYAPAASLTQLQRAGAGREIALFLRSGSDPAKVRQVAAQYVPPAVQVRTWDQLMPDLVQLIHLNEISMRLILLLVFALVGFGISNTFVLTLVERYREFGILKAMGVKPGELILLIFLESFTVCLLAVGLGLLVGGCLSSAAALQGIDFSNFTSHNRYFVVSGVVYPRLTAAGIVWPGAIALGVSVLSSYLPTRMAGKKSTADMLRHY
jgi:ABC-type lipoprotein release transport system permease subunit